MPATPGVIGRRYLPFIAVAAVQVLLVAIAPSKAPQSGIGSGGLGAAPSGLNGAGNPQTTPGGAAASGAGGLTAAAGGAAASGSGPTGAQGPAGTGPAVGTNGTGAGPLDLSHCDPKTGRQVGPTYYMPPCAPVWHGGDNGGATMGGVFPDHINYVLYITQGNPEVNAVLNVEGLAATAPQQCAAGKAFDAEINKRWEFYGRKLISLDGPGKNSGSAAGGCGYKYFQGQCSLTPPDPPCERAEADVIAAMKPAYVMAPVADPAFYNELGKKGVLVSGGESEPEVYHDSVAPYYYDVFMDGTRLANAVGEYWCKKLNAKPVRFAGADVMSTRGWGKTPGAPPIRKVGLTYPATNGDPTYKLTIDTFVADVTGKMCTTPGGVLTIPYQSDINTAQQQSQTQVNEFIQNRITSVICFCDPIAPVFITQTMKNNAYFPEQVMAGIGLIDYDILGRLYDPTEWAHAFGLSQLNNPLPFSQSDAVKAYQDGGFQGQPDSTENLLWGYFSLMATSLQVAGPMVTPSTMHQGLLALPASGWALSHDPHYELEKFAQPDSYTALEDMREVYWSSTRRSAVDGNAGSYCPVNGGQRFNLGEWPTGDPDVFDPAHNGC